MTDKIDIPKIHALMEQRRVATEQLSCGQCAIDMMIYGSAMHHTEKGHIPFEEAVKIVISMNQTPDDVFCGESVFRVLAELQITDEVSDDEKLASRDRWLGGDGK